MSTAREPSGYLVLIHEDDETWNDNWDGEVHETRAAGEKSLKDATDAGYNAVLAELYWTVPAPGGAR